MKSLLRNISAQVICFVLITTLLGIQHVDCKEDIREDPNGYIIFCLCMGRLGNQIETLLGALAFAKKLNRTMVVPHWLMFGTTDIIRKFSTFYQIEPLNEYHRVIDTDDFMKHIATKIWLPEERFLFCVKSGGTCTLENGRFTDSFGYTWNRLGVVFSSIMEYNFNVYDTDSWVKKFPGSEYPVLAFMGAPGKYPMKPEHRSIAKYLQWSEDVKQHGQVYIKQNIGDQMFIGIHLRNGRDWQKACQTVPGKTTYMASPQCFLPNSGEKITMDMCLPSKKEIIRLLEKVVKTTGATNIYVATDKYPMIKEITDSLKKYKVKVFHQDPWLPVVDLYILGQSDHFIGNCVSSFTSAVTRERAINGKPTSFWGYSK